MRRETRAARMVGRLACLLASAAWICAHAEIIDRIAISADDQVITESQIENDVRLTAFLNGEQPDLSAAGKKKAADRLIEQALVRREMEFSRYPLPPRTDADSSLAEIKMRYPNEAAFEQALKQYGISADELKERLWWQVTLLRFIDYRFRPGIQISDSEINAYYQQQVPKWREQNIHPIPSLDDSRAKIEEILTQQRIDQELDQWLKEARAQVNIRYRDEALQ
jgi:hypothetical protein